MERAFDIELFSVDLLSVVSFVSVLEACERSQHARCADGRDFFFQYVFRYVVFQIEFSDMVGDGIADFFLRLVVDGTCSVLFFEDGESDWQREDVDAFGFFGIVEREPCDLQASSSDIEEQSVGFFVVEEFSAR